MMTNANTDNVVHLDNNIYTEFMGYTIRRPQNSDEYLALCKRFMPEDQYRDLLCAIVDEEYFKSSIEGIQSIASIYLMMNMMDYEEADDDSN